MIPQQLGAQAAVFFLLCHPQYMASCLHDYLTVSINVLRLVLQPSLLYFRQIDAEGGREESAFHS